MECHSFWCIKCGNCGLPIYRKKSSLRKKFHKKKLYCIHCGIETNHIECRDDEEVQNFKELFKEGVYLKEASEYEE